MAGNFGVTPTGYKPMLITDVKADLEQALQSSFGTNINLAADSVFGQLVGIFSERLSLLWQLGQDVYGSAYPSSASGVGVDNILALNNLQRLPASPTVTAPQPVQQANGVTLYGLLLFGTPGTVVPAGALISDGKATPTQLKIDNTVTIKAGTNSRQTVVFSNAPTSGTFALQLTDGSGNTVTSAALPLSLAPNLATLTWSVAPTSGTYVLNLGAKATASIAYNATAPQVQAAVNLVGGFEQATVGTLSGGGLTLGFPGGGTPLVTATGSAAPSVTDSLQARLANLTLADGKTRPFSDLQVSAGASGYQFDFGALAPASGMPSSGSAAIPLIVPVNNTLQSGANVTNITVLQPLVGAPSQAVASATCTATGPFPVLAGALNTIVTPQNGWTGVTNQLDCAVGRDVESDAEAVARFQAVRSSQGSGSLTAVVERVKGVTGVSAAIGFENLTGAAVQTLRFLGSPTTGNYQLEAATGTTAPINATASALTVQAALAALPQMSPVQVSGSAAFGYSIDFNGAQGGQWQPILQVLNNSTGVGTSVAFGRPPHSVELVVSGGSTSDVATAVLDALPAGITSYGAPVQVTTGSCTAGSATLALADASGVQAGQTVQMPGIQPGTQVASLSGNAVTLTASALTSQTAAPCSLSWAYQLSDSSQTPVLVGISRPVPTLIFVSVTLVTDSYLVPGNPASGRNANAKWSPASVSTIQNNILAIGNSIPIGGLIVSQGSNGLVGSFQSVQGVVDYKLTFGSSLATQNSVNVQLQASQAPVFEAANIQVSFT